MMNFSNPRSGRTTRMLDHVNALVREGKFVYVVVATRQHAELLKCALVNVLASVRLKTITEMENVSFDWRNLYFPGQAKDSCIVIDHYAAEVYLRQYTRLYEMAHQFDAH